MFLRKRKQRPRRTKTQKEISSNVSFRHLYCCCASVVLRSRFYFEVRRTMRMSDAAFDGPGHAGDCHPICCPKLFTLSVRRYPFILASNWRYPFRAPLFCLKKQNNTGDGEAVPSARARLETRQPLARPPYPREQRHHEAAVWRVPAVQVLGTACYILGVFLHSDTAACCVLV